MAAMSLRYMNLTFDLKIIINRLLDRLKKHKCSHVLNNFFTEISMILIYMHLWY